MNNVQKKQGVIYSDYVAMEVVICCNCGVPFAMPSDLKDMFHNDPDRWFYCPNGHKQHYSESTETKLRKRLAEEERLRLQEKETAERKISNWVKWHGEVVKERDAAKRKLKRTETRIKNGVCPCCNRTFTNLQNHIQTQHPNFKP